MRLGTLKTLLIGLTAVFLAGCGGGDGGANSSVTARSAIVASVAFASTVPVVAQVKVSSNNAKGYVSSSKSWPQRSINVCWKMHTVEFANTAELRGIARQAVKDAWEDQSELAFLGWKMCDDSPDYHGIRIVVSDE